MVGISYLSQVDEKDFKSAIAVERNARIEYRSVTVGTYNTLFRVVIFGRLVVMVVVRIFAGIIENGLNFLSVFLFVLIFLPCRIVGFFKGMKSYVDGR